MASLFSNVAGLVTTLLEVRLCKRFAVNFASFFSTAVLQNIYYSILPSILQYLGYNIQECTR